MSCRHMPFTMAYFFYQFHFPSCIYALIRLSVFEKDKEVIDK